MATTYNELKSQIDEVNGAVVKLRYCVSDIENHLKFHIPLTDFFKAGRAQLDAAIYCYNGLAEMYAEAQEENTLKEWQLSYLETQLVGFDKLLDAYALRLKPIKINDDLIAKGEYTGTVTRVDDGDTFWMDDDIEVRMPGIDSPEIGHPNGVTKQKELESYILGKTITIKIDEHTPLDMYMRILGTPFLDGENITEKILSTCNCVVLDDYGKNKYVDYEQLKAIAKKCTLSFPNHGQVKIYGSPAKMNMIVNGIEVHQVTPDVLDLPLGQHTIELEAENYIPESITVDVAPGKQTYIVNLSKASLAEPASEPVLE